MTQTQDERIEKLEREVAELREALSLLLVEQPSEWAANREHRAAIVRAKAALVRLA